MTGEELDRLGKQLPPGGAASPPVHLWRPELSGDIDIVIHRDGSWSHDGAPIERESLVRLFASILRREEDGEYYLVTPVEKWRIRVECLPLQIVDVDCVTESDGKQQLNVVTNTGRRYRVGRDYPLYFVEHDGQFIPAVGLDNGLAAQISRAAWYRLVDAGEERDGAAGVYSGGLFFPLQPD